MGSERGSAVPLRLAGRTLYSTVITLDALPTLKLTTQRILAQDGEYLMVVKKHQANLYAYLDVRFLLPTHPADHELWDQVGLISKKGMGD